MSRRLASAIVLGLAVRATAASLTGGGPKAGDCLAGLDVVAAAAPRARAVTCHDGDRVCDRDGLVNGTSQYWLRVCLNTEEGCAGGGVQSVAITNELDPELLTLGRTLELVGKPATGTNTCGAMTTLGVPLGHRR